MKDPRMKGSNMRDWLELLLGFMAYASSLEDPAHQDFISLSIISLSNNVNDQSFKKLMILMNKSK